MKALLALTLLLSVTSSLASELVCYDLYSPSGSPPALRAVIHSNEELSNITIKEPFKKDGLLTQVKGDVLPNKFHTYKGLRGFILAPRVIFILPLDLSPQSLESTVLPGGVHPNPRQNAVLEVPGFRVSDEQGGDSYYRMHCYAK